MYHHQIIINRAPHRDGRQKTLTFRSSTFEPYVNYREIFEFLEERTDIPKKFFILHYNSKHITYIDVFLKFYESLACDNTIHITPSEPFDTMNIGINKNIDNNIYNYYRNTLKANQCEDTYMTLYKYADEYFSKNDTLSHKYYNTLTKYKDMFKRLTPTKRLNILTRIAILEKRIAKL